MLRASATGTLAAGAREGPPSRVTPAAFTSHRLRARPALRASKLLRVLKDTFPGGLGCAGQGDR